MDLSEMVVIEDDEVVAGVAHAEYDVLKEVYGNWRDGGNTDGLIAFIKNPSNSSYAVRNQLMLVAPKVSKDAWYECFFRETALNPWHFAQALLANSPLEPGVLEMLKNSDLGTFYKELVEDGQNGGVSMHSIYKSEIAHFYGRKATALQAMVRKSLASGTTADRTLTFQALNAYPTLAADAAKLALHYVAGDLVAARGLVDAHVQEGEDKDYWQVQDLLLSLKEQEHTALDLDGHDLPLLQNIANADGLGAAQACAWLMLFGEPMDEVVILPSDAKRIKPYKETHAPVAVQMLSVYPNPTNGPAYLVYTVPEGVEQAELRLHDANGRLLKQQRVAPQNGILEFGPKDLATGIHVASLYFDGIQVGSTKLNVVR